MAGFSRDEEAGRLASKLTDPSITPDDGSALRDRLMNGPPPTDNSSFLGRLAGSPVVQGAALAGPGAPGAFLAGLTAQGIARHAGGAPREMQSFTRDQPPGELQPMPAQFAQVDPAPALDARYGSAGTVGGGNFGSASAGAGGGLQSAWRTAQQGRLGNLEERKTLQSDLGNAEAAKIEGVANLEVAHADEQQRMAQAQQQQDEATSARFQQYLQKSDEYVDQIRQAKIDPFRLTRDASAGMQIQMAIGAIAGGALAGLQGGPNHYLQRLDTAIDRDIKAQSDAIDNKKFAVGARNTTFGQMLAEHGDRRLATIETKRMMLEASKQKLTAESSRLGIPTAKAKSALAVNAIDGQLKELDTQFKEQAFKLAQQQAAAAAASQRAAEERLWQHQKDIAELGLKKDEIQIKRDELGLNGAGGLGMTKEGRNKIAVEQYEGNQTSDEFNSQVDALKKHPALDNIGLGTAALSGFGARAAPGSTRTVQDLHQINTQMLQAVGKVAKDADGKPNKVMIEKLEQRFEIHPSDTKEQALQKLEGARATVNALARQSGATNAPVPVVAMPSSVKRTP